MGPAEYLKRRDLAIPLNMGKMPKVAANRRDRASPEWESFAALTEMARQARIRFEWCVVTVVVLSMIVALCILETATLKVYVLARRTSFSDKKSHHKWCIRPLGQYGATWAMPVHYVATKRLGRGPD